VLISPWVHRQHNLPRRIAASDSPLVTLPTIATQLAALLPAGDTRIFYLADPMPLHLAGRRSYLQQFNQERWGFTTLQAPERYRRVGMWGPAEVEAWLGGDARYAVLESDTVTFYRNRPRYRPILDRIDALLAERFTRIGEIRGRGDDTFVVFRANERVP